MSVGSGMLGRVVDALGFPMDRKPWWAVEKHYPTMEKPPAPLERARIDSPLATGVKAIDGMLTLGEGQRIGIFSGSGVGKSTLMGMIARNTSGDINVIALIGERGREVKEFIEKDLGPEGLKRSVVVVATSDEPALMRIKAAWCYRHCGVLQRPGLGAVDDDSLTRWHGSPRSGLATGEPRLQEVYPFSVRQPTQTTGESGMQLAREHHGHLYGAR